MAYESTTGTEEVFKAYKDKVYRLSVSLVHNEKDAEDIVQNTFIKILKNLSHFKRQSKISTWIYRIAYNESLMYLRKKYRQFKLSNRLSGELKIIPSGMFVNWSKIPDKELLEKEFKLRLQEAIQHLPIKYRLPLLLHHVENMPLSEAALVLGIRVSSLKSRLHRSLLMVGAAISAYLKDKKEIQEESKGRNCQQWLGFVYDYAKGAVNLEVKTKFKKHISDCPACNNFLESYSRALAITTALECKDIPPELTQKLESFWGLEHHN